MFAIALLLATNALSSFANETIRIDSCSSGSITEQRMLSIAQKTAIDVAGERSLERLRQLIDIDWSTLQRQESTSMAVFTFNSSKGQQFHFSSVVSLDDCHFELERSDELELLWLRGAGKATAHPMLFNLGSGFSRRLDAEPYTFMVDYRQPARTAPTGR